MDYMKEELERLNRNWWQHGDEKSLQEAKLFDKEHPKLKGKAVKDWQDMSLRYSLFCLRIIGFIQKTRDRETLGKIIKEIVTEPELLEILRMAWKQPQD
jgi:hypothetical protein